MAIYQRGKTYWYSFAFNGHRVQKSTKVKNAKEATLRKRHGHNSRVEKWDCRTGHASLSASSLIA